MLSRWLFSKLKAAENALRAGRIDDAYQRLTAPGAPDAAAAHKLLDELAPMIAARARLHMQAGRYADALNDFDKLVAVQRNTPETDGLRRQAEYEARRRAEQQVAGAEDYGRAAGAIQAGRLESGRLTVEQVEDARRREALREELDVRLRRSEQLLEQAERALAAGDVLAADRLWTEAVERHGRTQHTDSFALRLGTALKESCDRWLREGRLDRFNAAISAATTLRRHAPHLSEYERLRALTEHAAAQLVSAQFAVLRETLLKVQAACGDATWLRDALEAAAQIAAAHERLLRSPLSLLDHARGAAPHAAPAGPGLPPPPAAGSAEPLDDRAAYVRGGPVLLLVDGTASCLLTTRELVRIGRSGAADVDIAFPGELQQRHADIIRDGEDYFLTAHGPATVNGQATRRTLLRHGDRVQLAINVKFTFEKPSLKSDTAVLRLSDRCRLPQDVSHVVLLSGVCTIGPQPSAHIRAREGETPLVLFEREGRLHARSNVAEGAGQAARGVPLRPGEPREFGDVRITVKPYDPASSARRA